MRGMTGVKLYQELVAAGHAIPTIIITAHPEELALAGAREAGITCCLIKPFTPDELLECVHEALAKSQTRARYTKVLGDYPARQSPNATAQYGCTSSQWRADRHALNVEA
jgi:DNA-binding response OmpR family regulator